MVKGGVYDHLRFTGTMELPEHFVPPDDSLRNKEHVFAVFGPKSLSDHKRGPTAVPKAAVKREVATKASVEPSSTGGGPALSSTGAEDLVTKTRLDLVQRARTGLDVHGSVAVGLEMMQDSTLEDVDVVALGSMFSSVSAVVDNRLLDQLQGLQRTVLKNKVLKTDRDTMIAYAVNQTGTLRFVTKDFEKMTDDELNAEVEAQAQRGRLEADAAIEALKRLTIAVKNKEDVTTQSRLVFLHRPTAVLTDAARVPIKS
jgi:head-tail adaptor